MTWDGRKQMVEIIDGKSYDNKIFKLVNSY